MFISFAPSFVCCIYVLLFSLFIQVQVTLLCFCLCSFIFYFFIVRLKINLYMKCEIQFYDFKFGFYCAFPAGKWSVWMMECFTIFPTNLEKLSVQNWGKFAGKRLQHYLISVYISYLSCPILSNFASNTMHIVTNSINVIICLYFVCVLMKI